jgi:hypothetical protein
MSIIQKPMSDLISNNLDTIIETIPTLNNQNDSENPEYSGTYRNNIKRSHFVVAPSFGNLTSESCIMMDDNLKRSLFLVSTRISSILKNSNDDQLTWETLLHTMLQCPFVEKDDSIEKNVHETKTSTMSEYFNYGRYVYDKLQEETFEWLKEKISNDEYITLIGEDNLKKLAVIFSTYGSDTSSFSEFFADADSDEMKLLDVGIVRYPSVNRPYIELFRIEIYSKNTESKILSFGTTESQIILDMHSKKFVPNNVLLDQINQDMKAVIDREFEKMMLDLGL